MEPNRSLLEAYIQGTAELIVWLFPAIVTGLVVVFAQRAVFAPPENRGEKQ